ncbi:cell wall protein DAN4-like [Colletes gigas]|uniref:cell wall protein DAN4-like n=1 Tax=Colletes gigas TaxID=935657 RepID=UPI001C9B709A|nr:cell wall protein DAN4-like [Colletes gigas]
MRNVIFLATCISLIVCVWGNNLIIGKRQPGDVLITKKDIFKPRVFHRPQIGMCNATAHRGQHISFISVTTPNPWIMGIKIIEGGIGHSSVEVMGVSRPSWAVVMKCIIFASPKKKPTTEHTPTPTRSTTAKTTTAKTTTTRRPSTTTTTTSKPETTTDPTTPKPETTTEPTTSKPTTTEPTTQKPTTTDPTTPKPETTTY